MSANFPVVASGYSQFLSEKRDSHRPKLGKDTKALSRFQRWQEVIDSGRTSIVRSDLTLDLETFAGGFPDTSELTVVAPTEYSRSNLQAEAVDFGVVGVGGMGSSVLNVLASASSTLHISHLGSSSLRNSTLVRQPKRIREISLPLIKTPAKRVRRDEALTVPLQIWEGEVITVDWESGVMHVKLHAKIGNVSDHSADIDLQWVPEQDIDLVQPGAIFYWTLYKETTRGSVKNSEELRFRRLPNWSKTQIDSIRFDAEELYEYISNRDKAKS